MSHVGGEGQGSCFCRAGRRGCPWGGEVVSCQRTDLLVPLWHILVLQRLTRRSEFQVEVAVFAVRGVS